MPCYLSWPVSRVQSWMFIYLAIGLLQRSSDLTRSDTDVFTVGASSSMIGTYLVLLRAEIGRLTQILLSQNLARLCPLIAVFSVRRSSRAPFVFTPDAEGLSSPYGGRPLAAALLFGARTFLPIASRQRANTRPAKSVISLRI